MENHLVCPWCLTDIVWDEEIGPEKHCPHCGNELSAYRTIELGIDEEEDSESYEQEAQIIKPSSTNIAAGYVHHTAASQSSNWSDEEDEEDDDDDDAESSKNKRWLEEEEGGYRSADSSWFAVQDTVQRITDDQDEVPECPACREYMVETGTHTFNEQQFKARIAPSLNGPVLTAPFELSLYVCPACFHTSALLSSKDRERMIKRLTPGE
ncbi:hypothetical protein [Paenibacillus sp. sgz302251]|uniref:hypothetical protein n=1 Tax=Paenibacillus sp. sgz302251 TaxID=3414493 RepID=UPI003C7CE91D